jgi:hypothetical protein
LNKITSVKPTKNVKKAKEPVAKAKTLFDLIMENSKARLELARTYHEHKNHDRVKYNPAGDIISPFSTDDACRIRWESHWNESPETAKYKITQLMRFKSQEDDNYGKDCLIVQGIASIQDPATNVYQWGFSLGIVTTPVYRKKINGYSSETGRPLQVLDEIARFVDEPTIAFSKELVEELSKNFYKVSLVIKAPNGKKYTAKTVEQFCGDYDEVCKQLMPKEI